MRLIAITVLFVSSLCFAKTNLAIGASPEDSFSAEVSQDNPMQVEITNLKTQKIQKMGFKHSVSDIKKMTLTKTATKNTIEILLVVLSVSNSEQSVVVMAPGSMKEPLCSLRNEGDFSWDNDNDLKERVRVIAAGQIDKLQIKIGSRKTGTTKFSWMDCTAL